MNVTPRYNTLLIGCKHDRRLVCNLYHCVSAKSRGCLGLKCFLNFNAHFEPCDGQYVSFFVSQLMASNPQRHSTLPPLQSPTRTGSRGNYSKSLHFPGQTLLITPIHRLILYVTFKCRRYVSSYNRLRTGPCNCHC